LLSSICRARCAGSPPLRHFCAYAEGSAMMNNLVAIILGAVIGNAIIIGYFVCRSASLFQYHLFQYHHLFQCHRQRSPRSKQRSLPVRLGLGELREFPSPHTDKSDRENEMAVPSDDRAPLPECQLRPHPGCRALGPCRAPATISRGHKAASRGRKLTPVRAP
jgi:hypothetical protein